MTTTPNLGLTKDAPNEQYSVERVNANSDRIDNFAGDVNAVLAGKQDTLTFDNAPTSGSDNPVRSDGIKQALDAKASIGDIYGVKPTIAKETDLNTMTTPGAYACGGATIAATLGNCPTTIDAFILFVDHIAASSRTIQRLYCMNTSNGIITIYIRGKYSGGWGDWYAFQGTAVQPVNTPANAVNLSPQTEDM